MNRLPLGTVVCCAVGALFAPGAHAQVITFQDGVGPFAGYAGTRDVVLVGVLDSTINRPDANYSASEDEVDGFTSQVSTLMRWDVGSIPSAASVTSATMILDVIEGSTTQTYPAYECLRPWSETAATWLEPLAGVPWNISGAQGPGSDRSSIALALVTGPVATTSFALNPSGVAVVQKWVNSPATNFGLVIQNYDNSNGMKWRTCSSNTQSKRARLEVQFAFDGGTSLVAFQNGSSPTGAYAGCSDTAIGNGILLGQNANAHGLHAVNTLTALLSFEISAIPASAVIVSAALNVTISEPSSQVYSLYEIFRPWTETGATWATWDGTNTWTSAGANGAADRDSVVLASTPANVTGPVSIALNSAGVQLVQSWVRGTRSNYGVAIADTGLTNTLSLRDREWRLPAERPALVVTFIVPAGSDGGADAGSSDAGSSDAGSSDAGSSDAGSSDAGSSDAGLDRGTDGPGGGGGTTGSVHLAVGCGCDAGAGNVGLLAIGLAVAFICRRRVLAGRSG